MKGDVNKKLIVIGLILILILVIPIPSIYSQFDNFPRELLLQKNQSTCVNTVGKNNWWNGSWLYRKSMTIDHTKIDDDFINFPLLIYIPSDSDLANKTQDNGNDIVFTDISQNKLNHEIEFFNGVTGELIVWINVTNLSSIMNTTLCMYYGNSSANNQQNITGVWDSNFTLVQHLNETNGTHYDSTNYSNDGLPQNGVNQTAIGKIDGADEFDGNNDYIIVNNSASLDIVNLTIEAWFNIDNISSGGFWQGIVSKRLSAWTMTVNPDNYWPPRLIMYIGSKYRHSGPEAEITVNRWHHGALVINGSTAMLYLDGQKVVTHTSVSVGSTDSDVYIGRNHWSADDMFNGSIDEVRISNIVRTSSWINTSYNNQNNPVTFYSISKEEVYNNPPYEPYNPHPPNETTNVSNGCINWTGGDPDGDPVAYDIYFGNSSPPPLVSNNQTVTTYNPGVIKFNTTYYWQIVAWDNHSAVTKGPIWWFKTKDNHPPDIPIILGHSYGKPGIKYNFRTQLIDPDGDSIFCMWDWGDDSYSAWLGPFESDKFISSAHTWSKGSYELRVKAKDVHGAESNWSDPLTLVIENELPTAKIVKPEKALYFRNKKILPRYFRKPLLLGKIDITVDAFDDSGIKKVEFYIDNELRATDEGSPYTYTWTRDKITILKHKHTIKIIAFDNAGNRATSKIIVNRFF